VEDLEVDVESMAQIRMSYLLRMMHDAELQRRVFLQRRLLKLLGKQEKELKDPNKHRCRTRILESPKRMVFLLISEVLVILHQLMLLLAMLRLKLLLKGQAFELDIVEEIFIERDLAEMFTAVQSVAKNMVQMEILEKTILIVMKIRPIAIPIATMMFKTNSAPERNLITMEPDTGNVVTEK
jgi:hypothetical protein